MKVGRKMKEAVGYITEDGKFFEGMDEAEEYESWVALREALLEVPLEDLLKVGMLETDVFMSIIAAIPNEIRRYIDANEAATRYREIQASLSKEDNSFREDNTQTVLEQSPRIDEPLPDMGSSVIKETLRQQREIDGIGSGGTNAPDVRSSENLAIGAYTKSTKARLSSSTSHLRQG